METKRGRQPTNKWFVTQITAMTALLVAWVNVGAWDKTVTIGLIGFASQALISYITPNHEDAGGVRPRPVSTSGSVKPHGHRAALPRQRSVGPERASGTFAGTPTKGLT